MGFRYRKTIKICKGVRLNISKSGPSLTLGQKGVSLNIGQRGTYVNASIPKTGLSYRQKLNVNDLFNRQSTSSVSKASQEDKERVELYNNNLQYMLKLYRYCNNVVSESDFKQKLYSTPEGTSRELLEKLINGDKEFIEAMIGRFNENLEIPYEVDSSFELNDHTLFVDLDLPEIESFDTQYPTLTLSNQLLIKDKPLTQQRQEYAQIVMALPIFLAANYFNISSYITNITLSAYTSKRNNIGDLVNYYIYSIQFERSTFERTDLRSIDKAYDFLLRFTNRINLQPNSSFKQIVPYGTSEEATAAENNHNPLIDEAVEGLKELGYKQTEIKKVLPHLEQLSFDSSDKYLKEALLMLLRNKSLDTL